MRRNTTRLRRSTLGLLPGLVALTLIAGCGGGGTSAEGGSPAANATGAPVATGGADVPAEANVALSGVISTMDPAAPRTANDYVPSLLVSGQLYRMDANRVPQLDLLEDAKVSDDGLTVTHTLKSGLKYSDGTPVVAEDAVVALKRLRDTPGAYLFDRVKSASAPDDRTIVWKLKAPYPDFPDVLAQQYLLMHPHEAVEADAESYFKHPVSAGPFMIADWTPGGPSMTVKANPQYWATPKLKGIKFQSVQDLSSRALQLTQGQLDYVFDLPPSTRDSFPPAVTVEPHPLGGMYNVTFNLDQKGPLADPKVRQAISLAIDRDAVAEKAFFGLGKPACAYLYSGTDAHECMLPNDGKQDLDAARELLSQTPYKDGFKFELQVWNRPGWGDAALIIAENLAEIGIKAEVTPLEDAVAVERLGSGDFQAQFSGNTGSPVIFLQNELLPGTFWGDAARYDDPAVAKLLDAASRESEPATRKELLTKAQKEVYRQMPHIPIIDRAVLSGSRLPADVLTAMTPGEYLVAGVDAK
jgi:peptide/nickel transport system substrate-binding protein